MTKLLTILITFLLGFSPGVKTTTPITPTTGSDNNSKSQSLNVGSGSTSSGSTSTQTKKTDGTTSVGSSSSSGTSKTSSSGSAKTSTKTTKTKTCEEGYAINPATNRCKKLQTVSETSTTITTTTWNPVTGETTTSKSCKNGYWFNASTNRCNKVKTCSIGYEYQASTNTCKKIVCEFGYKVQDASNKCKRIICEVGHILNQKTGNCVINRNGKYKECETGWTLDLTTLECAKIGTKGSNDPASKKSAGQAVFATVSKISSVSSGLVEIATAEDVVFSGGSGVRFSNTIISTDSDGSTEDQFEETEPISDSGSESATKTCPEGKFLNPKTNRCKNIQTISEGTTGKTITTYDTTTGEATTMKICNDGYYLNTETNRCNKVKDTTTSSTSKSSSSSSSSSTTTKTCPEGKFLNPKTNRCKNIQTVSESTTGKTVTTYDPETGEATTEKICNEGYELNPDTNRCNKVKENSGASDPISVPDLGGETETNFIAISATILVILAGISFVIFQFRKEIFKFFKKVGDKIRGFFPRKSVK